MIRKSPHWRREAVRFALLLVLSGAIYWMGDYWWDLPPSALTFHSEHIRAEPSDKDVTFVCTFEFIAHHPRRKSYEIAFPTHLDESESPPRQVEVAVDERPVTAKIKSQGFIFRLSVQSGRTHRVSLRYTIVAPEKKAVYITRTANLWPKPIAKARFDVPKGVVSNYHVDGRETVEFANFSPNDDWRIQWQ